MANHHLSNWGRVGRSGGRGVERKGGGVTINLQKHFKLLIDNQDAGVCECVYWPVFFSELQT